MNIHKKILGSIEKVYATAYTKIDNELLFLAATEGRGQCCAYGHAGNQETVVWDGPGGTMNIVPIPGREGEFLATQQFFPVFDAKECMLHYVKYEEGSWSVKPVMPFPYLHRFDLFVISGEVYFIGATLCSGKEFQQDWSKPGAVYVGKLSESFDKPFETKKVLDGITKNHGFCAVTWDEKRGYFITGVEGVFLVYIPEDADGEWKTERILDHEVSDIAVCDIDGDGHLEIGTIEPFHGNKFVIYKKDVQWKPVYEQDIDFGHVVWGGDILGKQSFLVGYRRDRMELMCIQKDKSTGKMVTIQIDEDTGPSQISVAHEKDRVFILSANRQIDEVALYELKKA